eukprot:m.215301 g.215301  ORF g.215301 m.215301 type:complete len:325 (-) comp22203_c0_seq2:2825-3799(-)
MAAEVPALPPPTTTTSAVMVCCSRPLPTEGPLRGSWPGSRRIFCPSGEESMPCASPAAPTEAGKTASTSTSTKTIARLITIARKEVFFFVLFTSLCNFYSLVWLLELLHDGAEGRPLLGTVLPALLHEIHEGHGLGLGSRRDGGAQAFEHGVRQVQQVGEVGVRHLARDQLPQHNAKAEDIHGRAIGLMQQNFGRTPAQRAHTTRHVGVQAGGVRAVTAVRVKQSAGQTRCAQIRHLDGPVFTDKQVAAFHVTMDPWRAQLMKISKALCSIQGKGSAQRPAQRHARVQQAVQTSPDTVLADNVGLTSIRPHAVAIKVHNVAGAD